MFFVDQSWKRHLSRCFDGAEDLQQWSGGSAQDRVAVIVKARLFCITPPGRQGARTDAQSRLV